MTKAPDVSVLADGLAVSHYVEALEAGFREAHVVFSLEFWAWSQALQARTPRSPRKTGSQVLQTPALGVGLSVRLYKLPKQETFVKVECARSESKPSAVCL